MSWDQYVTSKLVNSDFKGHKWENICESGALLDVNAGTPWTKGFNMGKIKVKSDGKDIEVDQAGNLVDAFKQPDGNTKKPGGIYLNGVKYIVTNFDQGEGIMYLKKQGGGASIAKTGKALVVATWAQAKKGKKDGKETAQNPGDCSCVVEDLAAYLKSINY